MDMEQAERFVAAAEHDYEMAVGWYCAMLEGKAEGPEDIVQPRADVLAAQQVLDLARREEWQARHDHEERERVRIARERVMRESDGQPNLGRCDSCQQVAPLWRRGAVALCLECATVDV